jgi:dTDP-4-dehydrorhamnose reductase
MSVLITGGMGILGTELKKVFSNVITPTHEELDICNKNKVFDYLKKEDVDLVIHTAAVTKIRLCEENRGLAMDVNVNGTRNLVDALIELKKNTRFIYISTACVFDGHTGMYKESSIPYPENFYALTKLLGEYEVKKLRNHLIVRTNFVSKQKWPYPKAFTDRFGTYLFTDQVAAGLKEVDKANLEGFIHIVGDKKISMFEIAKMTTPEILPMTMKEYSGPRLTIDMTLDTERWKKYTVSL